MLEVLQDAKLMGDLVTLHQLLVHELCGHCSFGSLLVAFLNHSKSAPVRLVREKGHRALWDGDLTPMRRPYFAGSHGEGTCR